MPEVVEINDVEELESYRLAWAALLNETPQASFFRSLDWLQAYWKHFGRGQRLRTLVVFSGGRPIGILPLAVRLERTRVGKLAVLTYPLHDWGSFYGPIGPNPTATLFAGVRHIRDSEQDWELFDPRWVAAECDRGRTETAMQVGDLAPRKQLWKTTWIVDGADSWAAYLGGRDAGFTRRLRRIERHAATAGQVTFERYRPGGQAHGDADPRWDLFSQCIDIDARSWYSSSRRSLSQPALSGPALSQPALSRHSLSATAKSLRHESIRAFLRDAHLAAAKRGALDVCLLKLDGRPIAYAYNYQLDGRVQSLHAGFHPSFESLGSTTLLMSSMIRDSIERGDSSLDLGEDTSFNGAWATRSLSSLRYTHYAPASPRAQLLRAKHWWDARRRSG